MPPDTRTFRNSIYGSYERTIDVESTDLTSWRAGLKRSRSRDKYDTTFSLDFYYDNLMPFGNRPRSPRHWCRRSPGRAAMWTTPCFRAGAT
jgi:hypothetical protein